MEKVIITGATSMLGIATIESLLSHSIEKIYAIVRTNSYNIKRIPQDSRIVVLECDITNYAELPCLIADNCDTFYHFAWSLTSSNRNSDAIEQSKNIQYSLEALYAAKKCGCTHFIGAGSQAEYGVHYELKTKPNSITNPVQQYGIAKLCAGMLCREEAAKIGMSCSWVRIFSVYGKYDLPTTMISSTITKLKNGERPSFTPAEQMWDYLYSGDAGEAFYAIGEKAKGINIYCLGSGNARPLREYIEIMRDTVNPLAEIGIGDIAYSRNTVMNLCADITALTEDTGWVPKTSFLDGIKSLV